MTGALEFDRWDAFGDTFGPYRVWTLRRDVPGLDLRRGDKIFEVGPGEHDQDFEKKPYWGSQRFQARRPQKVGVPETIRELEEWQAADLFGGEIPPWPLEGTALQQIHSAMMDIMPMGQKALGEVGGAMAKMLEYMAKKTPKTATESAQAVAPHGSSVPLAHLYRLSPDEEERHAHALLALASIPDTVVRQGDYLTYTRYGKDTEPTLHGAVAVRVPRAQLATVEAHFSRLRVLHVYFHPDWTTSDQELRELRKSLRHHQRPTWKDSTSPLLIVRPLVAPVSEPIAAASDDGAIFELLCQVSESMHQVEAVP